MKHRQYRYLLLDFLSQIESPSLFISKLEDLSEEEKWQLVNVSIREGLQGLLYSSIPEQAFPVEIHEKLKTEYYRTFSRIILLTETFLPIARELELRGIDFLMLKGIIYSQYLYDTPGLRPTKDVDCLIHREDAGEVDTILRDFGFEQTRHDEMNYIRYDAIPLVIDVHTKLFFPPEKNLWKTSRKIKISGHLFYTPDLENQLVYLIAHPLIQHGYLKLIWVNDFLFFLRKHKVDIDSSRFRALTRSYGLEVPFFHFLNFCKKHFSNAYPELNQFSIERQASQKTVFFADAIFQKCISASKPFEMGILLYFLLLPSIREKIHFLSEVFFPDNKFLLKRHGRVPGTWGRRIFRPLYLIAKGMRRTIEWVFS